MVHRVNAGGSSLAGTPTWGEDSSTSPSPYVNAADTGNTTFSTANTIDMTHASIPAGTPEALLQSERWDGAVAPEMEWNFPVTAGSHEVRLYFAEIYSGTQSVGARVFDVFVEGKLVLDDYDVFAEVGGYKAVMKSFLVSSDANVDIDFGHVTEHPAIKGIEIVRSEARANELGASPTSVDFGSVALNTTATQSLQLTNLGGAGDPSIVVDATSITGTDAAQFGDDFDDAANVTLAPGQSTNVAVNFTPTTSGAKSATLEVAHSGTNSP
ncbi:MAG: choice-of-anchor D domain-containing protein, partial [Actinobacteria bacterium]|nr:choice-of-anchor D domain-containing protein [Actinomycetota bacterium]